ncbi:MAG: group 1 truncated hemoglobin [Rickettsiales bacterium]|nr:group 1 truncated hemoglobin [Rickettsiales bacterium]
MSKSLFERIGGKPAVKATVIKMYEKILDDPSLAPFFENIDVDKLRLSQTDFVTYAFGGPNHYTGQSLRTVHAGAVAHGLTDKHFDAVATHLKTAMEELNVPADLIAEALAIVGSTRSDVLGKN